MNMRATQCCAIQEIGGLAQHRNALEAMHEFCKINIGPSKPKFGGTTGKHLYSFYLFTSALATDGTHGVTSGSGGRTLYGRNFMKLIKKHKLGTVWESPSKVNAAFHPDHSNQVYMWMPEEKGMFEWWSKQKQLRVERPKLFGEWRIEKLPTSPTATYSICRGDYNGDIGTYDGCGSKMTTSSVSLVKYAENRRTGQQLCADCGWLTRNEIQAAEKDINLPTRGRSADAWIFHKRAPAFTLGYTCSGGVFPQAKQEYDRYYGKTKHPVVVGCSNTIEEGKPVLLLYNGGRHTGSIFCEKCAEKCEEALLNAAYAVEDTYDDEWDDEGSGDAGWIDINEGA